MAAGRAQVLLIDEGELDDVAHALGGLGATLTRTRADELAGLELRSFGLLVTTAGCGLTLGRFAEVAPVRLAVASDESRTLRGALRRAGFDYLVHRPVHPEALRLLLARLVYHGPEKRRAARVAIGLPVRFRTGIRRRDATLVDLSPTGCRLLCARPPSEGSRITLQLPDGAAARPWILRGVVSRRRAAGQPLAAGAGEAWSVAIAFDLLSADARARLERWLSEHASGPAAWRGAPVAGLVRSNQDTREQRRSPRRSYGKRVIALAESGARVLLARDLSLGGLCVEAAPGLAPGARVRVALHGSPLAQPLVVAARVARRSAPGDVILRFEDLDDDARERLAKLLADQPEIEALASTRGAARRRVVTHLVGVP